MCQPLSAPKRAAINFVFMPCLKHLSNNSAFNVSSWTNCRKTSILFARAYQALVNFPVFLCFPCFSFLIQWFSFFVFWGSFSFPLHHFFISSLSAQSQLLSKEWHTKLSEKERQKKPRKGRIRVQIVGDMSVLFSWFCTSSTQKNDFHNYLTLT